MREINRIFRFLLLALAFSLALYGADKEVELKAGWNQIRIPYDRIKIELLSANDDIEVIWAYQNGRYNLATNVLEYKLLAKDSHDIGLINSLSYGESIYVLAKRATTLTFVGSDNYNPPVRANQITSRWKQMSRHDFKATQYNVISRIVEGYPVIAAKLVMKDNRPSLKIFTNDSSQASKIPAEFFEDFEVGEDESFWIKDISSVEDIDTFDVTLEDTPNQGGALATLGIDARSTNKNRSYLSVRIVALKEGESSENETVLFDDYVKINYGKQNIKTIMPMLEEGMSGNYRIYVIKDLSAQYDKHGIDIFNLANEDSSNVQEVYDAILKSSQSFDVTLNGNSTESIYDMKVQSREYANSVLLYNPYNALNRIAKNRLVDIATLSYNDLDKHTEFQLTLEAYGNSGETIDTTDIKAFINVNGSQEPVVVLNQAGDLANLPKLKIA